MVGPSQVRAWAQRLLDVEDSRDPDAIAQLFALDATFEDPVGGDILTGRDAIRATFAQAAINMSAVEIRRTTPISVAELYAAYGVTASIETQGSRRELDSVTVVHFGSDGLIASLRAYWNYEEMRSVGTNGESGPDG
jgi:steroid delta-isomerase